MTAFNAGGYMPHSARPNQPLKMLRRNFLPQPASESERNANIFRERLPAQIAKAAEPFAPPQSKQIKSIRAPIARHKQDRPRTECIEAGQVQTGRHPPTITFGNAVQYDQYRFPAEFNIKPGWFQVM
jgi:hypothetical protein